MKYECNVARDLMPLMLDGAASEESQALLNEHLDECADCKAYYAGMQAALPMARNTGKQEQKAFDEAARKLRRKRRVRLWRRIAIGVLAGMVLMYGGLRIWSELTQKLNTLVYFGQYNVFLSQLDDGRVSVNMDFMGSSRYMMVRMENDVEDGKHILYVYNETTRIPQYLSQSLRNYSCARLSAGDMETLNEIRSGVPDEYMIVWQAGNAIPAASEEMETYYAIETEMAMIRFWETENGKMHAVSFEDNQRYQELSDQLMEIWKTVPEWQ
ncbi:MAG: zf-HC2 domain-containing protein [Firmicutes bacterium]|nr:zf-HC2 domain-containing protein [Bacillota bacterium]